MPQTEGGGSRNPEVAGGEQATQQQANELKTAAGPAKEQSEQQFADLTPNSPPEGVEFDDPRRAVDPMPSYEDEDQEFLFGMTDLPDESPAMGGSRRPVPPKSAYKYLSALVKAAEDPDAPPELHAFIRILAEALSTGDSEYTDDGPLTEDDVFAVADSEYAQIGRRAPSRTEGLKQGQMP